MASRADQAGIAVAGASSSPQRRPAPRLGAVIRAAFTDYYFNSMRLVAANVVWGAGVLVVILVGVAWPLGGLLLSPFLALPTAGVFRLAAGIVRTEPRVSVRNAFIPYRHRVRSTLLFGTAFVASGVVLGTNLLVGLGTGGPPGWVIATLAGWGLIALWCGALVAWPLLVDPVRGTGPTRERLRLAGGLLLVDPVRFGALGVAVAMMAVVSTILTAAILTVSISFIALVACRSVYPVADRLETAMGGERA